MSDNDDDDDDEEARARARVKKITVGVGSLGPRRGDPVRTIRDPVELDGIP